MVIASHATVTGCAGGFFGLSGPGKNTPAPRLLRARYNGIRIFPIGIARGNVGKYKIKPVQLYFRTYKPYVLYAVQLSIYTIQATAVSRIFLIRRQSLTKENTRNQKEEIKIHCIID